MTLDLKTEVTSIEHYPKQVAHESLKSFKKGCRIMGLTRGQYSLIDLIRATLDKTGRASVICMSWSAGIKDARNIKWMLESNLIDRFCIITDHSYKNRQKKYAVAIEELFGVDNIRTSKIHAKFVLIWNDDFKVCIRTSMNLNANRTCENFELDEDETIFKFYNDFAMGIIKEMPPGFTSPNGIVNGALDRIFNASAEASKWWLQ